MKIDLNADLGETEGRLNPDAVLMPLISSANIACGAHAGSEALMRRAVELALEFGVSIGAHPGYPDRKGFGRRTLGLSREALFDSLSDQLRLMQDICRQAGARLRHVKAHGALYNQAMDNPGLAQLLCQVIHDCNQELIVLGMPGSALENQVRNMKMLWAAEGFADRAYTPEGRLLARSLPGAVLHDPDAIGRRALTMILSGFIPADNESKAIFADLDSLCVHGDSPGALAILTRLHETFLAEGIAVETFAGRRLSL